MLRTLDPLGGNSFKVYRYSRALRQTLNMILKFSESNSQTGF